MSSSYVNDLRLEEIGTGDQSGTWGTTTNTNLELIGEALGYGTQDCFTSDADATTTVADGATDPARAMYFKVTSSATLTATRTLTIGPNTISRVMFIENATTGSQSINISQGSGANVTIATGRTAVVYLDGAGSGAAVVDALALVDPGVTDTLAEVLVAGNTSGGTNIELTTTDKVQFRDTAIYINSSADGQLDIVADTEVQIAATTIDVNGTLAFDSLKGTGATTVTNILDEDNMGSDSATALATQQSIKAYVDSQVGSFDTLAEVLAQGNTTGGTDIAVSSGDDITFADSSKAIFGAGSDLQIYHDGSNSFIDDAGTGSLQLQQGGSTKLEVTTTGIDVTGTATMDELTVEASSPDVIVKDTQAHTTTDGPKIQFQGKGPNATNYNFGYIQGLSNGSNNAGDVVIGTNTSGVQYQRMRLEDNGDVSLYENTGTTAKFFWDASAESLGIGTTSPTAPLHINGTTAGQIRSQATTGFAGLHNTNSSGNFYHMIDNSTGAGFSSGAYARVLYSDGAYPMAFYTNANERMRINSDGALLVGTTTTFPGSVTNVAGIHFGGTTPGRGYFSNDGGRALNLNRMTSDGDIIEFRKDSTTVGSIGTNSDKMYFAGANEGIAIDDSLNAVIPVTSTGAGNNDAVDLGASGGPMFKDLHLSSTAYVGTSLGVGTTSPSVPIHAYKSQTSPTILARFENPGDEAIVEIKSKNTDLGVLQFADTEDANVGAIQYSHSDNSMRLKTNDSEAMRIDVSGNLLVGKTTTNLASDGVQLFNDGFIHATATQAVANSGTVASIRRSSTDGSLVDFYKDGSTVGSIGSEVAGNAELYIKGGAANDDALWLVGGDCGIRLDGATNTIVPTEETSGGADDKVSLGNATYRFKDLHMSGTAYAGRVGINTNSPNSYAGYGALTLDGTNGSVVDFETNGTFVGEVYSNGTNGIGIQAIGARSINFETNSVDRMVIDSAGNVGQGIAPVPDSSSYDGGTLHVHNPSTSASTGAALRLTNGVNGATAGTKGFYLSQFSDTNTYFVNREGGVIFYTAGSEAMRIDSSQKLLVGKTASNANSAGAELQDGAGGNAAIIGTASVQPLILNRLTTDGDIALFRKDNTTVGSVGVDNNDNFYIGAAASGHGGFYFGNGNAAPMAAGTRADNTVDLGTSSYRFKDLYRAGSTISTSDRNMKQDERDLTEAETRVAQACKGLLKAFRFIDAVEVDGDNARIHFGIIAQELQAAFEAEGLDATKYAMFRPSTYTDDEGNEQIRLGVCYENLLTFIIAAI